MYRYIYQKPTEIFGCVHRIKITLNSMRGVCPISQKPSFLHLTYLPSGSSLAVHTNNASVCKKMNCPNVSSYSQNIRYPRRRRGSYNRSSAASSSARGQSRRESLNSSAHSHYRNSQNPYGVLSPYAGSSPSVATNELSSTEHGRHRDNYLKRAENQCDKSAEKVAFQAPSDRDIRADTRTYDVDVQFPDDNDSYDTVRRFLYRILTSSGWGISEKYPSAVRATVNDWYGTGYYLRLRYSNNDLKDICPATWMEHQGHRNLPEAIDRRLRDMVASCVIHEVGKRIDRRYGNQAPLLSRPSSFASLRRMSNINYTWVDTPFEEPPVIDPKIAGTGYWSPIAPVPLRPFRRSTIPETWSQYIQGNTPLYAPITCTPAPQTPSERFETFLNESVSAPVVRDHEPRLHKQSIRKCTWKTLRGWFVQEQKEPNHDPCLLRTIRFEDTASCRPPLLDSMPAAQHNGSAISLHLDPPASATFRSTPFSRTAGRLFGIKVVEKPNRDWNRTQVANPKENHSILSITASESERSVKNATDIKFSGNKRSALSDGPYMQHIPQYNDSTIQCARPRSVSAGDVMDGIPTQAPSPGFGTPTSTKIGGMNAQSHIDDGKRDTVMMQREYTITYKPVSLHSSIGVSSPARAALPQEPLKDIQTSMMTSTHQSEWNSFQKDTIECPTGNPGGIAKNMGSTGESSFEASKPLKKKKNLWGKKLVMAITPANFR